MPTKLTSCDELAAYRQRLTAQHDPNRTCITVCGGTGCRACQGLDVAESFRQALRDLVPKGQVNLRVTGCLGFCEKGPVVTIQPQGLIYVKTTPQDAKEVVEKNHPPRPGRRAAVPEGPPHGQAAAHARRHPVLQEPDADYLRREFRSGSPKHR